jgi:superfamily II DNA or RNA helicase
MAYCNSRSGFSLFDYQARAVGDLRAAYAAGYQAPLLVLPTGGGKTVCFTYVAQRAVERARRVLIVVHRRELVTQTSKALKEWGVAHGLILPAAPVTDEPVQVAMVQTLARRVRKPDAALAFDFIIVDEAHHGIQSSSWGQVLKAYPDAKYLGVTATPCRLDGKGLGKHVQGFFDTLVVGPSVSELIEQGRLVRPVVFAPESGPELSGIKKNAGDYAQGALAERMMGAGITGDAVAHYRRQCEGAPGIAFTVTRAHAAAVTAEFQAAGYQAALLTGETPDRERAAMIEDLGAGRLNVLASCNVVSEGTDIPAVVAAILLRPTASYALAMQQMGRALRTAPGKDRAIILDHAGNCLRHGLPTEPMAWSLDGIQKTRGARQDAPVKRCEDCGAIVPIRAGECLECGAAFAVAPVVPNTRKGDLVELTAERVMTPAQRAAQRRRRLAEERLAASVHELAKIGKQRGYRYPLAWAQHRFDELKRGRAS